MHKERSVSSSLSRAGILALAIVSGAAWCLVHQPWFDKWRSTRALWSDVRRGDLTGYWQVNRIEAPSDVGNPVLSAKFQPLGFRFSESVAGTVTLLGANQKRKEEATANKLDGDHLNIEMSAHPADSTRFKLAWLNQRRILLIGPEGERLLLSKTESNNFGVPEVVWSKPSSASAGLPSTPFSHNKKDKHKVKWSPGEKPTRDQTYVEPLAKDEPDSSGEAPDPPSETPSGDSSGDTPAKQEPSGN